MAHALPSQECHHAPGCPMIGRFMLATTLLFWRDRFCLGRFEECERQRHLAACAETKACLPEPAIAGAR